VSLTGSAILAYFHYASIFLTFAFGFGEAVLYRPTMDAGYLERLKRIDVLYLFGAMAIVITGLLRLFFGGKGTAFYIHNPVFWLKMAMFAAVALLSIVPTVHYLKFPKTGDVSIARAEHRRVRTFILLQLIIFICIPIAATFMARGIGLSPELPNAFNF